MTAISQTPDPNAEPAPLEEDTDGYLPVYYTSPEPVPTYDEEGNPVSYENGHSAGYTTDGGWVYVDQQSVWYNSYTDTYETWTAGYYYEKPGQQNSLVYNWGSTGAQGYDPNDYDQLFNHEEAHAAEGYAHGEGTLEDNDACYSKYDPANDTGRCSTNPPQRDDAGVC